MYGGGLRVGSGGGLGKYHVYCFEGSSAVFVFEDPVDFF